MRARRSCISVPASSAKMLAKAPALPADEVVLDLEDSVPPDGKDRARDAAAAALAQDGWTAATVSVRINGVGTPWCERDVGVLADAPGDRLDCLVVPKAEGADEVAFVDRMVGGIEEETERGRRIGLEALVETARGLREVHEIAESSARLEALILGPADLAASLGYPPLEDDPGGGERWDFARGTVLVAARAAGLQAIDGPHLQIDDLDGLRRSASRARALGYDGKWALHPSQVEPLNELFSPSAEEVDRARVIVDALGAETVHGAILLDGEMIDEASRKRAEHLLARSRAAEE
ncbi:MAG: HpcH/HpaI aldolase/citrate lyase family protein [Solirubrobacterales bacterium]